MTTDGTVISSLSNGAPLQSTDIIPFERVNVDAPNTNVRGSMNDVAAYIKNAPAAGRIITAAGNVTVLTTDGLLEIAKTVPAATEVIIPDGMPAYKVFTIKDGGFNAGTYPITLTPASGEIDGNSTFIIESDGQSVSFYSNGTNIRIV